MDNETLFKYMEDKRDEMVEALREFIAIPSVSSDKEQVLRYAS